MRRRGRSFQVTSFVFSSLLFLCSVFYCPEFLVCEGVCTQHGVIYCCTGESLLLNPELKSDVGFF